ncbi:XRE family transcriptional regulator [Streptomyces sp. NPDC098781]|uniref:XRE family transcriptional regulator n=1 Tax=Streptomyces sp. NPDC098781 TaxID=3366097 RepID=UPI003806503B
MGNVGELSLDEDEDVPLHDVRDAAGFIAAMKRLKARSGLTYRELEERAARRGDVLARSTLADILRRTSMPRPEVLAAFVRACGDGARLDAWLATRDRLAAAHTVEASVPARDAETYAPRQPEGAALVRLRRTKGSTLAGALTLAIAMLALAAWVLLPGDTAERGTQGAPVDGWVTIHPARTVDLCLTDGRDRDGAYDSAVAVQLPCAQAPVPRTYLEPMGEGLYRIQWHHPQMGKGCLTVMGANQIKGMLEPRQDCAQGTLFRWEATAGTFRLRPATSGGCIGIVGNDTTVGAEAIEERCSGGADQRFLIRTS